MAKGSWVLLTGDVPVPATTHPNYRFWKSENSSIIAWLINTMEVGMRKTYMYLPTAKDVWDAVKLSYSDIKSFSQIYDLKSKLWNLKQDDRDVTTYYNELMALWQELDQCYDYNWRCTEDSVQFTKTQENDRVFIFLAGLNKELDEVRGRILGNNPLPTIRETFSEIRRVEARQRVMMGKSNSATDGSALVTNNFNKDSKKYVKKDGKPWCDHCERYYHTRETCWKIHGRPPNWKKKGEGRALQATSDQEQQSSPNAFPFTKEQLDQMYKLLESQTPSCSIAQKGNFPKSAHLSVIPTRTWIVDSGATDHMTGESSLFSSYKPCAGNFNIKLADGSLSAVAGKGSIVLSPLLTIQDVLHVPNLSCNLLSVSTLITNKSCQVNFFDTHCVFQDLISGRVIGTAEQSGGLYYLEDEPKTRHQSGPISFSSVKSFFV